MTGQVEEAGYNSPLAKQWHDKLVGKTIVDRPVAADSEFAASDLPGASRVLRPGSLQTMDFRPERVNVTVDASGKVQHVRTG
ncbi:hypothetical protein V1514DRAFT_353671 [Lipomyces japonicus]|uniref:uncharacterized protein n=1 Tax=Lipomyces japonicus TaxID=56871 RepID=UPI0034CDA560